MINNYLKPLMFLIIEITYNVLKKSNHRCKRKLILRCTERTNKFPRMTRKSRQIRHPNVLAGSHEDLEHCEIAGKGHPVRETPAAGRVLPCLPLCCHIGTHSQPITNLSTLLLLFFVLHSCPNARSSKDNTQNIPQKTCRGKTEIY